MDNRSLITQRTGDVALTESTFTPDQVEVMEKVLSICDRNPSLVWKDNDPNHNLDFCIVEGKIEPVKGFCLKCIKVAGFSVESDAAPFMSQVPSRSGDIDTAVSVKVSIYKEGGPRFTLWGASSIFECDRGGRNKRALHDAVARAQTRALKLAVETAVGMPFINLVLMKLFGGYEVTGSPSDEGAGARNVTGTATVEETETPEARATWKRIWNMASLAKKDRILTQADVDAVTEEVKLNMARPNVLLDIERDLAQRIVTRRKATHADQ